MAINAEILANRIYISAPLSRKEDCQSVPGARWDKDEKMWHVPLSWGSCKALRGVFGTDLQIGDKLTVWAKNELNERVFPALNLRNTVDLPDDGTMPGLYAFQRAGAQFLFTARHALLGDEMGSGKTIQTIAAAKAIEERYQNEKREASKGYLSFLWGIERCEGENLSIVQTIQETGESSSNVSSLPLSCGEGSGQGRFLLQCPVHGRIDQVSLGEPDGQFKRCVGLQQYVFPVSSIDGYSIQPSMGRENVSLNEITGWEPKTRLQGSLPVLIICPASMRRTWGREVKKWWPEAPVHVVEGTAAQRAKILAHAADNPGFVIINWESVRLHSRLAPYGSIALSPKERTPGILNQIPFKLVVADEAHRMKDPKSKQARAVWACAHNPTVEYRWALTGTPLTAAPDTLWPVLHFMDPNEWPSKTAFIERYCLKSFNIWGGLDVFGIRPDREEEFFAIFDPRFRRMPKEVVLPQLPPIQYVTKDVKMAAKQQKAYDSMAEKLWAMTDDGDMVIASNPISQMTRLTQYASATIEEIEGEGLRLCEPSSKLDAFMDDLDDLGTGLVVFSVSRQLLNMLSARFEKAKLSFGVIQGGQSADVRQNAIDAFQSGKIDYILVVVAAGGVGITLTRSSTAVFLQVPWSNVDYQQAIGRIHRIGSEIHNSVSVIHYLTEGTVEEHMIQVVENKEEMLQQIMRDADSIKKFLKGKE